jgi:hypothetical protein
MADSCERGDELSGSGATELAISCNTLLKAVSIHDAIL